jgi:hypothetical protein
MGARGSSPDASVDFPSQVRDALVVLNPDVAGDSPAADGPVLLFADAIDSLAGIPVDVPSIGAPDGPGPGCASLKALAASGPITSSRASQVLFSGDGRWLLLQASGVALSVQLPSGEMRVLAQAVRNVDWLGKDQALVTTNPQGDLLALALDGSTSKTIATKVCAHAATPDGSRVYYNHDCDTSTGDVAVVDVATGASQELASRGWNSSLVVSPGGRWAAFHSYAPPSDASATPATVWVVDAQGNAYAASQDSGYSPVFISDDILLYQSPTETYRDTKIWRHTPGTRTSLLLGQGDPGFFGYETNPDRSAILVANPTAGTLDLVPLDGSGAVRLLGGLIDYSRYQLAFRAFAFAPFGNRALYVFEHAADGGWGSGLASVTTPTTGNSQLVLNWGSGVFALSPYADRVATTNYDYMADRSTVQILSSNTAAGQFAFDEAGSLSALTFVPGDTGFLFIAKPVGGTSKLRHFSFASGMVSTLAEWNISNLLPLSYASSMGGQEGAYPVDPSGCFALVDSDLPTPGTRLVMLPD